MATPWVARSATVRAHACSLVPPLPPPEVSADRCERSGDEVATWGWTPNEREGTRAVKGGSSGEVQSHYCGPAQGKVEIAREAVCPVSREAARDGHAVTVPACSRPLRPDCGRPDAVEALCWPSRSCVRDDGSGGAAQIAFRYNTERQQDRCPDVTWSNRNASRAVLARLKLSAAQHSGHCNVRRLGNRDIAIPSVNTTTEAA